MLRRIIHLTNIVNRKVNRLHKLGKKRKKQKTLKPIRRKPSRKSSASTVDKMAPSTNDMAPNSFDGGVSRAGKPDPIPGPPKIRKRSHADFKSTPVSKRVESKLPTTTIAQNALHANSASLADTREIKASSSIASGGFELTNGTVGLTITPETTISMVDSG